MRYFALSALLAVIVTMFGCSSGKPDPILSPSAQIPNQTQNIETANPHHLWGYYTIAIDSESMTADAIPLRIADFTANVTRFMQPPLSPTNMLSISILGGSNPSVGYFEIDITLQHPFPGLANFRGFDVRGIMISNGSVALAHDSSAIYQGDSDARLLNADGHTRWWNAMEFTSYEKIFGFTPGKLAPPIYPTATLNGYKYFSAGLGYDSELWELDPASRGTFPINPGVYTRPYKIQFAMDGGKPDFSFNYAIDASWEPPDPSGAPNYDIDSFNLSANMAEAYCIAVEDIGSTAYFIDSTSSGGELRLAIRIFDWQSVENPDGVEGELNAIWVESPVLSTPLDVLPIATVLPDGPTSSVFEVSLGSLNLTKSGDEPFIVFAEALDGFGYEPQIVGGDAFDYPNAPLGAYLFTSVYIKDIGDEAPIVTGIDPDSAHSGDFLTGVKVYGFHFNPGSQVELRHDEWPTIEAINEVTMVGGQIIECDIDLYLAAQGTWDVAVINPDLQEGVLEDGFTVFCAEAVHEYEGKYYLTGGLTWNYCQRGDLTILEAGKYAGQCVLKRYYGGAPDYPGYYVRFDPDNPSNTNEVDYFNVPGRKDDAVAYVTMTAQIDQNPVNAHIAVVNGRMFDVIQIVDEDGNKVENITITDPQTVSGQVPLAGAVDFDVNGDLWVVTNVKGIPDEVGNPIWQLRHYELQDSSPYYVENLDDRLDITEDLFNPDAQPYGYMWYAADIAISYAEQSLFVMTASISGWNRSWFAKYDIATSPPSLVTTVDIIPSMVWCSNPFGVSRCDIEFDHSDLSVENCRLLVMYQTWTGEINVKLMRLDTD
ncbi:MAG TPA: hypothetical protein ENN67_00015, partial [Firmicutes bacterium]|nr:hypothetical protein [Bacillota bacterium]